MDKVRPCVKVQRVIVSSFCCAFLSAHVSISPWYCTHLLPFQMLMGLNHAGALELEVNSLLWREFMDGHAEFLTFCSAGSKNFFVVANSFWPQSQQLTAMHHGCLTIVTMYNGTKSTYGVHSVFPPTTVCPMFSPMLPGFFILVHWLLSKVFETV